MIVRGANQGHLFGQDKGNRPVVKREEIISVKEGEEYRPVFRLVKRFDYK